MIKIIKFHLKISDNQIVLIMKNSAAYMFLIWDILKLISNICGNIFACQIDIFLETKNPICIQRMDMLNY